MNVTSTVEVIKNDLRLPENDNDSGVCVVVLIALGIFSSVYNQNLPFPSYPWRYRGGLIFISANIYYRSWIAKIIGGQTSGIPLVNSGRTRRQRIIVICFVHK